MLLQGHPDIFPDHAHPCTDDSVWLFPNDYWVTCKQQNGSDYITRNIILLIFFSLFVKTKKLLASWKSDQEKNKPFFISKMQNFHRILFFFLHGMTHSVTREIILLLLFFSSHLHDKVKILCIFKTLIGFISSEYWFHCCFIGHIRIILSRFCNTLPLTYERSYQSFDKVAIQIFWHHLLIKMRPWFTLILNMHHSAVCSMIDLILQFWHR